MRFELYPAARLLRRAQWRWRLIAPNNRIVAVSGEGYINKRDALDAIELVKNSGKAPVKSR